MSTARLERLIGSVLLAGVFASAVIVCSGGALFLWRHGGATVHYRVFRGEPSDLCSIEGAVKDAKSFSGRGIIQLGLMLLVAVQVVRVGLATFLFAVSRDRVFVLVSLLVLGMLSYGLLVQGR